MLHLNWVIIVQNKVIAISGYTGSGKTTISEYILNQRKDFIYFDFGFLFRPLTYYLFNELNLTEEEISQMVKDGTLYQMLNFSFKLEDNKIRIGINGKYYSQEELYTLKMNMDSVTIGTMIGDDLTPQLQYIVGELKKKSNVLLNARRPVVAYPDLDHHIFLEADFDVRLKRKMKMNNEDYETTYSKLQKRDQKEQCGGFWQKYDFTEVIDTSLLTKEEVISKVFSILESKIKITYINNLTLVLGSYKCNKNCPYCIAKNNKKFESKDNLEELNALLNSLELEGIKFSRFVLSGNGEPSMYSVDELKIIKEALIKHAQLFDLIRIHSSGNIFALEEKFSLFNNLPMPLEFEVLRVSLDPKIDKQVLGYEQDYLKSPLFQKGKSIKCDIALTDYLDFSNLKEDLKQFLVANPSISKIRLKKLLVGDSDTTIQASWVRKHSLSDEVIIEIIKSLGLVLKEDGSYESLDKKIVYKESGDYDNDIVINNGKIQDYKYNTYNVKMLKRKFGE